MAKAINLNADMGEGFGAWEMGDDAALMKIIRSASIACGYHAGDPATMHRLVTLAATVLCAAAAYALGGPGRARGPRLPEAVRPAPIAHVCGWWRTTHILLWLVAHHPQREPTATMAATA